MTRQSKDWEKLLQLREIKVEKAEPEILTSPAERLKALGKPASMGSKAWIAQRTTWEGKNQIKERREKEEREPEETEAQLTAEEIKELLTRQKEKKCENQSKKY